MRRQDKGGGGTVVEVRWSALVVVVEVVEVEVVNMGRQG
jgi:hypothetical protein